MVFIGLLYVAAFILFTDSSPGGGIADKAMERSVIVIGAGVSGLAAARKLRQHGFANVKVLDAKDRIGGRANTLVLDADRFIELGAQWIHGEEDNSAYALAVEKGLVYHEPTDEEDVLAFRTESGTPLDTEHGKAVRKALEEALQNSHTVEDGRFKNSKDYLDFMLLKFHETNPGLDKAVTEALWKVAEAEMRADDGCDSFAQMSPASYSEFRYCEGNYFGLLKKGYVSLVQALAKDIPKESIMLRQAAALVDTNEGAGVRVLTKDGTEYRADHVIVTVSLGVLKAKARQMFIPSLPRKKLEAFQALGFGTVDKVFLEFQSPFWEEDGWDVFFPVWIGDKIDPQSSWQHGIVSFDVSYTTRNTLVGWLSGEAARQMEAQDDEDIISSCLDVLKRFTGRRSLPKVVAMHRSRWFSDEDFRGSYSFRTVESNLIFGLNNTLSEPLYGRTSSGKRNSPVVMFAGEYTHPYYYSTVHGALDSGEREADRLVQFYQDAN